MPAIGRPTAICLCAIAILLGVTITTFSQGNAGRILGTVSDQTGGAIAGATVTVTDTARNATRTLTTDASGSYNAPDLTPSTYLIRAEAKGFKALERQNIVIEVGQDARVDLVLQPGEQTQTVTVTEAVPLMNTTNAELGGTLQNQVMEDLPLNGRNFQNLLSLRPGVVKYVGNAGWTNASNGNRPHDNMYLVNGVDSQRPLDGAEHHERRYGRRAMPAPCSPSRRLTNSKRFSTLRAIRLETGRGHQRRPQVRNQPDPWNGLCLWPGRIMGRTRLLRSRSGSTTSGSS